MHYLWEHLKARRAKNQPDDSQDGHNQDQPWRGEVNMRKTGNVASVWKGGFDISFTPRKLPVQFIIARAIWLYQIINTWLTDHMRLQAIVAVM